TIVVIILLAVAIGGYIGYGYYNKIYGKNIKIEQETILYIPTGTDYNGLLFILTEQGIIENIEDFKWVAQQKDFNKVRPGKYKLSSDIASNNDLVNFLRSAPQEPVMVTINNIRKLEQVPGKIAPYFEMDSIAFAQVILNEDVHSKYGFTSERFLTMFITNTYQFYWNTTPEEFLVRMADEYKKFWNDDRKAKAAKLNLSQSDVSVLASIVQEEQNKFADERPMIAGVYVNRIKRGMALEADPTLKFAWNDFSIKRVLNKHKEILSPYNTYKVNGLPPGPICLPEISSIDAVLNYENHDYIFMCAKDDLSGYHSFAKTNAQHEQNARRYQQKLNELGIK
ncbi:MAG: endolytic transglycosylase MltG, partial [Bacteroidales bacterium]|nr:endolytic transglycosylase MltG [Bacteroidales bacterium]